MVYTLRMRIVTDGHAPSYGYPPSLDPGYAPVEGLIRSKAFAEIHKSDKGMLLQYTGATLVRDADRNG